MSLDERKPVFGFCEQQRRRPISASVICLLESIISKLDTGEISIFQLVSVAEEVSLNLTLSETPKTGFVAQLYLVFFLENTRIITRSAHL